MKVAYTNAYGIGTNPSGGVSVELTPETPGDADLLIRHGYSALGTPPIFRDDVEHDDEGRPLSGRRNPAWEKVAALARLCRSGAEQ